MKAWALRSAVISVAVSMAGCVPQWAQDNSSPYIMEIASITAEDGSLPIMSDVNNINTDTGTDSIVNDNAQVNVNIFRKNNNPQLGTTPVEHIYLERYEVLYTRTDGRNQEGVDVPFRVTGAMGNVRFHTPGPGGAGEVEITSVITIVRHQAKLEPPLRNLRRFGINDTGVFNVPAQAVLTCTAEITIHGRTLQGDALVAVGRVPVTFADFADTTGGGGGGGGGGQ
jgi:hypothetical protein